MSRSADQALRHVAGRRPRVLHIGSPTGLYGAERWILALVRYLPSLGIDSVIGAIKDQPGDEPPICVHARELGIPGVAFEAHGRMSGAAIGKLRTFILEQNIDILHTHGYKSDILGALAVRGTACAIVSTPHGWSVNAGTKLRVYEFLNRLAFHLHDAVVPLSADLRDGLANWPLLRPKLELITNGVDLAEVDGVQEGDRELDALRARGVRVVGYIGQLIPRKGVDVLIRSFAKLALPGRVLCIVGEGEQRQALERLAVDTGVASMVRFVGYRRDRLNLLKSFDALVLPSSLEGIPRCVLESMAARIPAVVTDIPGCRDIIDHRRTGLVFPVGDSQALAAALTELLTDQVLRDRLVDAAELRVRGEYSAAAMAGKYAALYGRFCRSDAVLPSVA